MSEKPTPHHMLAPAEPRFVAYFNSSDAGSITYTAADGESAYMTYTNSFQLMSAQARLCRENTADGYTLAHVAIHQVDGIKQTTEMWVKS